MKISATIRGLTKPLGRPQLARLRERILSRGPQRGTAHISAGKSTHDVAPPRHLKRPRNLLRTLPE